MTPSLNIKQDYAIRFEMVQEGYFVSSHPFFLLEPFYSLTYCPHTLELETEWTIPIHFTQGQLNWAYREMKRIYNGKELEQMVSYTIAWSKLANYINQSKKATFNP